MTRYLVDSDGIIDYLNGMPETVALLQDFDGQGDVLATCDIVFAEVYSGLAPSDRPAATRLLATLEYLTIPPEAAQQAGIWRYAHARAGRALPATDCLIAAAAHHHGATVLTGNTRHYPMTELTVQQLPRPQAGRGR